MSAKLPPLVLASASPRRSELLRGVGLEIEMIPSGVPEEGPRENPATFAQHVARKKGLEVAARLADPSRTILAADTIVVLGTEIFEKPNDAAHAEAMLARLQGRTHMVITAYCLARSPDVVLFEELVRTHVRFRPLDAREIRGYVATGEPMDKAGAYAAQGIGMFLIEAVQGSYSNVVGLPVCEVVRALERIHGTRLFPEVSE